MSLAGKRVLVTGGTGFLGRHVCRKLEEAGALPLAIGSEVDLTDEWRGEQTDFSFWIRLWNQHDVNVEDFTHIVHLAANCGGIGKNQAAPMQLMRDNLVMGTNVLGIAHEYGMKCLIVGTVCSYPADTPVPFKESDLWNGYPEPTNAPYGIAKKTVMELAMAYHRECGLNVVNLILANLYGPGDNFDLETSHVIPAIVRKVVDAQPDEQVALWGDGKPSRDFLYVEDAAEAIVRSLAFRKSPDPLNIGTGVETHVYKLPWIIGSLANRVDVTWRWNTERPNGQQRRCLDITKAREELGWQPKVSLEEGLRRTVEWYKANKGEA